MVAEVSSVTNALASKKPSRSASVTAAPDVARTLQRPPTVPAALPWFIQASLRVGAVDDPLEREADHIADQVTQTGSPAALQRSCCDGKATPCAECTDEREVRRKSASAIGRFDAPANVSTALHGPGVPLAPKARTSMERALGYSFGEVRIHADPCATQSADDIRADAYTVGRDVVFASGRYAPDTPSGQRLLAHELVHVIQQGSATGGLVRRQTNGDGQSPGDGGGSTGAGVDLASQLSTSSTITCDFGQGRVFCTFQDIDHALEVDNCEQVALRTYDACIKNDTSRNCLSKVRCAVCQCVGPKLCSCTGMI